MESLHPVNPTEPPVVTESVDLEQEKNRKPMNSIDVVRTTITPEIQQDIQETKSTTSPNIRMTTHKWVQKSTYSSVEFQPSSAVQELESGREMEATTQEDLDNTMFYSAITQNVQKVESSSSSKTGTSPHKWGQIPTSRSITFLNPLGIGSLEFEKETENTSALKTEQLTATTPEMMVPDSHSRTTIYADTSGQEPNHPSFTSQSSSTTPDLESKRVTETTTHWDMNKTTPDPEMQEIAQERESTSTEKTWTASHTWEQNPTHPSIESLPPLDRGNLEFETENETASPSGTEHHSATQGLTSVTDVVPSLHWDSTSEEPSVTGNMGPINSSAETQPIAARCVREPEEELEATIDGTKEPVLFSNRLEVTIGMDLPTTTEKEQTINHTETVSLQILNAEENASQQQQERQNTDLRPMRPTGSNFLPNTQSTLDGTDVHNTTDRPQNPRSPTDAIGELLKDGLLSSGDEENGMSYSDVTSAPDPTDALSPDNSSADAVTHCPQPSKASPGCPIKRDPMEEDQACGCSSPALGKLAHAMEGLHGELGSLSTAIHHQGFQLEAVAHSLAELAASVHHLVKVLPILVGKAPAQPSTASLGQDEDLLPNQLPLK
ncbi:hypothetical protein JRQ81_005547 [Phrynocephalus forsythii]|uniref:Uncharacterized protein n=1 Tax=Phrynocephalus forsythii TaxID=171643 RepID=A0A9Q0XGR0_9SAUR|nr:hypothetical protein JRQ81_005547 [Phrynocephalus forsythii]